HAPDAAEALQAFAAPSLSRGFRGRTNCEVVWPLPCAACRARLRLPPELAIGCWPESSKAARASSPRWQRFPCLERSTEFRAARPRFFEVETFPVRRSRRGRVPSNSLQVSVFESQTPSYEYLVTI